jgi:opacity protein-like surface antigen
MKRSYFAFIGFFILLILFPYSSMGQDKPNYVVLRGGAYFPTGDLEKKGFENGYGGEIAYGRYFLRNFAAELGSGYYHTDHNGGIIRIAPITITAKGILPFETSELYVGLGAGRYVVDSDIKEFDDHKWISGGHILAGYNYNITPNYFIGIEGKYIMTEHAEFESGTAKLSIDLDGITVMASAGIRF